MLKSSHCLFCPTKSSEPKKHTDKLKQAIFIFCQLTNQLIDLSFSSIDTVIHVKNIYDVHINKRGIFKRKWLGSV